MSNPPKSDADSGAPSLSRRIRDGGLLTVGGYSAGQVLRLLSNLILTRLLAPEAFGLMAIAVAINIWAVMLTDIGIASSVIRSRNGEDPSFIRTAWSLQIIRNLIVFVIIALCAVGVFLLSEGGVFNPESAYADQRLPWVMLAAGAQLLIMAFVSINQITAQRRLHYSRVVGLEITTQIITMVATISFAFAGYGVWALVIGMLTGAVVNMGLSHAVFPGPSMRFVFKREYAEEIFHFGKWLIIASFFGFLVNRGDQILFGGMMPSDRFGIYAIAAIWMTAAAAMIQTIFNRLFYPAFSEILRDRPHDISNAYQKARLAADGISVAIAFGAFFLSEFVFAILYPDNYTGVGYFLKLLSPFFLLAPLRLINTIVLAGGDSKNFTAVTVIAGASMLLFTPIVYFAFGEKAAVVCFASIELVAAPIIWKLGSKSIKLNVLTEARVLVAMAILWALIFFTA